MSGKELIDALRAAAEERLLALRRETDAEVEAIKRRTMERLAQVRRDAGDRQSKDAKEHSLRVLSEAGTRARTARLAAEHRLAERLLTIARRALRELRENDGDALFAGLARELPNLDWAVVRVHPADQDRARAFFPRAVIIVDESISGGLAASTADDRITVVNTLERRLERAWPELLPELRQAVSREASNNGPSGAS